ncbi:MAG TPA: FUSC family protein [Enteractinococcus helveticum]|uniref:FUSC family protein n=1 Tax=Enteractinococcus helveticum TaxID=1837282 RepID=A0A921K9Q3_9MICC|nr:FUSC family protein [Enteractinococcus helveticum]HJF15309.1 FUSC family protein [Enteractinococcus helveticum]
MAERMHTTPLPVTPEPSGWQKVKKFFSSRFRSGAWRARKALIPAATSAIAAVAAYAFAAIIFGHSEPYFAATSALISLGFGRDPHIRKALEVAIGVTLGILVGDTLQALLGQGYWQGVIVVFVTIILARFIDAGVIFTTQMSIQAVLVVLLPIPIEGPLSRSVDAVIGGVIAIAITMLMPVSFRKEAVAGMRELFTSITATLRELSSALEEQDSRSSWVALIEARGLQSKIDSVRAELSRADQTATYSPTQRSARQDLQEMSRTLEKTDLAVRSLRIIARRVITVIDEFDTKSPKGDDLQRMSAWFSDAADAIGILGRSVAEPVAPGRHRSLSVARNALGAATTKLTPHNLGANTLHGEALVMMCRPMMVDFIEATGSDHHEASNYLPNV